MASSRGTESSRNETPMEIPKKRFAKGEINEQKYDLKKKKLES